MSLPPLTLLLSYASPFANKVLKTAKVLDIPLVCLEEMPFDSTERLTAINPLSKVPALIFAGEDGKDHALYDSAVICQYLESLGRDNGRKVEVLPAQGLGRWRALRDEALCDGISEAAVLLTMEGRRPPEVQSDAARQRWEAAIWRALGDIAGRLDAFTAGPLLPRIALGCALDYIDLRHRERLDWRSRYPELEQGTARP